MNRDVDAFENRGAGDFIASHDMEDIVTLLDGRAEIVDEVRSSPVDVREYLAGKFREFLGNRSFLDALPGHLLPDPASQHRAPILLKRIKYIANLDQ